MSSQWHLYKETIYFKGHLVVSLAMVLVHFILHRDHESPSKDRSLGCVPMVALLCLLIDLDSQTGRFFCPDVVMVFKYNYDPYRILNYTNYRLISRQESLPTPVAGEILSSLATQDPNTSPAQWKSLETALRGETRAEPALPLEPPQAYNQAKIPQQLKQAILECIPHTH